MIAYREANFPNIWHLAKLISKLASDTKATIAEGKGKPVSSNKVEEAACQENSSLCDESCKTSGFCSAGLGSHGLQEYISRPLAVTGKMQRLNIQNDLAN